MTRRAELLAIIRESEPKRWLVTKILDRSDDRGRFPQRMTIEGRSALDTEAAIDLFSTTCVRKAGRDGAMVIDLAKAAKALHADYALDLASLLYDALERAPRDIPAERQAAADDLARAVGTLRNEFGGLAAAWLHTTSADVAAQKGPAYSSLAALGRDGVVELARLAARAIEVLESNTSPIRLANFSYRIAKSTKTIRPGETPYIWAADALWNLRPDLRDTILVPRDESHERRRLVFEACGVFRNESAIDVLCYGDFQLRSANERIDFPHRGHRLGQPVRLTLQNLRDAAIEIGRAQRVTTIENETTFNDYIERAGPKDGMEIVICTAGQPNAAVIALLELIDAPTRHWGDLDPFGVHILRTLRRRTARPIEPLHMDVPTYEEHLALGERFNDEHERVLERMLQDPREDGPILRAMDAHRIQVEQESLADAILSV